MCSSLKVYYLLARACSVEIFPLADLGLEENLTSIAWVSLLLGWEDDSEARHIDLSGLDLLSFSSALTLTTISSACSPCNTNCFQVRHSTTLIWAKSMICILWRQVSTNINCVMPLGHQSDILRNLFTNNLMDSPFFCFVARGVGTNISISSSMKRARNSFSRSAQVLIESAGSFIHHSKATPLRVPMDKRVMMALFDTTFLVWDLK